MWQLANMFLEAILLRTVPLGELWGSAFIPQGLQHRIVRGIYSREPGRGGCDSGLPAWLSPKESLNFVPVLLLMP